ncbi:MAG: cytochrome c3 family protein [Desulfobacterales bacterium]|nr:cytochrome c3 family protein [Desulfobacterales bacterium]
MKKRRVALLIGLAVLACMLAFMPAYSQEDITSLKDEAFGKGERPAAAFAHEDHNEKAEIEECNVCHHVHKDGELVEDESSEGQSCSDCHNVKEGYPTPSLMKAYHDLCKACHLENKKGPVTCGECHPRGGSVASHETH